MVNKNYNRGRQFEYRVKKDLENKGYLVVRSAGSKSPFDLIGISSPSNADVVLLVQCKYGAKISKKERDKLRELDNKTPYSTFIIIAWAKPNKPITYCDSYNKVVTW